MTMKPSFSHVCTFTAASTHVLLPNPLYASTPRASSAHISFLAFSGSTVLLKPSSGKTDSWPLDSDPSVDSSRDEKFAPAEIESRKCTNENLGNLWNLSEVRGPISKSGLPEMRPLFLVWAPFWEVKKTKTHKKTTMDRPKMHLAQSSVK